MNRIALIASAITASALVGAAVLVNRRTGAGADALPDNVIPIISPVITMELAEHVLSRMEHLPPDEATVVLHTEGGEITACIMIADALRKFRRSTAIVPYMAFSGGTVIALNATQLQLGKNAALSAVDPVIFGMRGRHIPAMVDDTDNPLHPLAAEYDTAVSGYLRQTLLARLGAASDGVVGRAMDTFMGLERPHSWPIHSGQLRDLGLSVASAGTEWSKYVDEYRKVCRKYALAYAGRGDVHRPQSDDRRWQHG